MTALAFNATVDAYPLGRPHDGTLRYGMTPEQAILYRWLLKHKSHDEPFSFDYRHASRLFVCSPSNLHSRATALVERGWLKNDDGRYSFVQPIKSFREPTRG